METTALELTQTERAALDYFGEELALSIEDACPRLDVRSIDLEIGIKLAASPRASTQSARRPGTPFTRGSRGPVGARGAVEGDQHDTAPEGAGGLET